MNGVMDSFTPAEYMAGAADDYRIIDVNPAGPTIPGWTSVDLTAVDAQVLANPRGRNPGIREKMKSFCLYVQRGKRAYQLPEQDETYGYTNTRVLEGSSSLM